MEIKIRPYGEILRRWGLGLFFLGFGLIKLTDGSFFTDNVYSGFYSVSVPLTVLWAVGLVQIAMAASFFMDRYTQYAAWLAVLMNASTLFATMPKLLEFFTLPPPSGPPGFLFFSIIPIFLMSLSEALKDFDHKARGSSKQVVIRREAMPVQKVESKPEPAPKPEPKSEGSSDMKEQLKKELLEELRKEKSE